MKKTFALTLSTLAVLSTCALPAHAAEEGGVLSVVVGMPLKAVSVAAAVVVGTPIAIARKIGNNTVDMTKNVAGDDNNPVMTGLSGIVAAPIGVVAGAVEGSYYGVSNAVTNVDKPFSKEQMSLGEYGNK